MARTHTMLFSGLLAFAVFTGVLAWQAGYFAMHPEYVSATDDSLAIEGTDTKLEARLRDQIQLAGFLRRGKDTYVAIVNDQVVEPGGVVIVELGNERHELRVESISENRVLLRKL